MAWESRELVPDGVNVGGWFCLEDWFYSQASGDKTGHFVATPNLDYQQKTFQLNHDNLVGHVGTIFSITKSEDWVIHGDTTSSESTEFSEISKTKALCCSASFQICQIGP